jgi:hypothetical protein
MKSVSILITTLILVLSCAAPIKMEKSSKEPLVQYNQLEILPLENQIVGEINEDVVNKIMSRSIKDIIKINRFSEISVAQGITLVGGDGEKVKKSDVVISPDSLGLSENDLVASFQIRLIKYKKGNAFLRFLFGALAGSGEVQLELEVFDKNSGGSVLKATTASKISGAFSSEENVIAPLSRAVVKFVKDNFTNG